MTDEITAEPVKTEIADVVCAYTHEKLEDISEELAEATEKTVSEMQDYYIKLVNDDDVEALDAKTTEKLASLKRATANIGKSYQSIIDVNDELEARWRDIKNSRKKTIIPAAPANAVIDLEEKKSKHFARGVNFYKLMLLCTAGSFIGVVIELIWCLITNGYFESRSGLVYGPFNLLYGAGAAMLTIFLYRYRNRGSWTSFFGGMLIGSVFEYACSFVQELLVGSRSWDYSNMPFNINGRICLLYSVFWGILGVLWVKNIYPRMAKWILKIPNKIGKIAVWILVAFFAVNSLVTCVTIWRWSQRVNGAEPTDGFWGFVDERFPNERMESIFANMSFGEKSDELK